MLCIGGSLNIKKLSKGYLSVIALSAVASLSLYSPVAQAKQTVLLKIEGISQPELNKNVRVFLSQISNDDADGSEYFRYTVKNTIVKALQALGYFNTGVNFKLIPRKAPAKDLLIAKVTLDKPVRLDTPSVKIVGDANSDKRFQELLKTLPKAGTILNQSNYDEFKSSLQNLASSYGYFDGEYTTSQLLVMPDSHRSLWNLTYNSGARYKFGRVTFKNSQIDDALLYNMLPEDVRDNKYYSIYRISDLTSKYNDSNWFKSVLLAPSLDTKDHFVNLDVLLQPRLQNQVNLGLGFSTDVGPRFQVGWNKPWINRWGHSVTSNLYLSSPEKSLEFSYKIPVIKHPLQQYYEFGLAFEDTNNNDTQSISTTLSGMRYWNQNTGWQYSAGAKARYDNFTQASENEKTLLLYPSGGITRTRVRGGLFPTWGDKQSLSVDIGSKLWVSDVDFIRLRASTAWIRTVTKNNRFIIRGDIGYLKAGQLSKIPPSLRFFAGGGRSVRGYGYQKISPTDSDGKLIGGTRLLTGSLEYQYQFYPDWWAAAFTDTGLASYAYSAKDLKYGTGIGIRWASPIGAVKFDLARPILDKEKNSNIEFYIGLGTEL